MKSFYVPRSHPDGFSVNARCLDAGTIESMSVAPFNGREWEAARDTLQAPHGYGAAAPAYVGFPRRYVANPPALLSVPSIM